MISRIPRLPFGLSIWTKLFIGLFVVVLIPVMIVIFTVVQETRTITRENLRAYLEEKGISRQQAVSADVEQARQEITSLVANPTYYDLLLQVIFAEATNPVEIPGLRQYIDQTLVSSRLFSEIVLTDIDGRVLLSSASLSGAAPVPRYNFGMDFSSNTGYEAGQSAAALNQDQRLSLGTSTDGRLLIYVTEVVRFQDTVYAFLIGQINLDTVVLSHLVDTNIYRETYSYLALSNDRVVAPEGYEDVAAASSLVAPLGRAFNNQSGLAEYDVNGRDTIGHYAPVAGTPFVILTELDTATNNAGIIQRVVSDAMVLFLVIGVLIVGFAAALYQLIVPGMEQVRQSIDELADYEFDAPLLVVDRRDEVGNLARSLVAARAQISTLVRDLQQRVQARVRDVQATQEISRVATTQRDLQTLMDSVVELIITRFHNIYHAQIFLVDAAGDYAVLRSSTGEAGERLLERGHRLATSSVSVVGRAAGEGRVVVASDIESSDVHRPNPFLPETRAELAIPLRFGDHVIGVLDVQSREANSFTADQTNILQTMGDQIAVALENARLYQESVQRLEELTISNRDATYDAWREYIQARRRREFVAEAGTATGDMIELRQAAIASGETAIGEPTARDTVPVAVPIILRGQSLGAVEWEIPVTAFNQEKVDLAVELVNRLAISLDNARLFQESQRAITRERMVNEISARLTGQTDIDDILRNAVREVGLALQSPQVHIHLKPPARTNGVRRNGHGDSKPDASA